MEQENFLNKLAQIIYDKKGMNILALEVKKVPCIADYFLIAEGSVERHVSAIASSILKEFPNDPVRTEGLETGDWVIIDFFHIVIHLFREGIREKYALEKLWKEGKIVDLKIRV